MNNVSLNGVITPSEQAVVSVMDHGFLYGMGLFETLRTYNGVPFLLDRHLARLRSSCQSLGIQWDDSTAHVQAQITELMQANGLEEAYIRYTVSAGNDIVGLPAGPYEQPNVVIYAKSLGSPRPTVINPDEHLSDRQHRLSGKSKSLRRLHTVRNTPEGDIRLKSLHYMNSILGKRELLQYGDHPAAAVEGLMLTSEGHLAEGIVSNLFFIKENCLYTPSVDTGILPGITRAFVMELAQQLELPVEKGMYSWEQLRTADEIFLTNSVQEIVPVTRLLEEEAQHIVSDGQPGPYTQQLVIAYEKEACRS